MTGKVWTGLLFAALLLPTLAATAAESWPEFRGPFGNGMVDAPDAAAPTALPVTWSETENVLWKTEIPHKGWSTPVVLNGQVWLTTATPEGHDYFALCVDAETGAVLFNERLFHSDNPEPLGNEVNCYASPTPAIEPGRVYLHFGSYGTACLDTATFAVLWKREDLPCRHFRGPGSSAILFENLLILTFDGADVQYTAALDKATGATVWRTDRSTKWKDLDDQGRPQREGDFRKSFCTPLVFDAAGRKQLVTTSSYAVFSYDARTGEELWTIDHTAYSPAPRPVFADGLVYVATGRGKSSLLAVRPDGAGDVTGSHIAWELSGKAVPLEPSPILHEGLLYLLSNEGVVTCLEAATGAEVWTGRVGGGYMASPILANGLIYCSSTQGRTTVIKAGRAFEKIAENRLDEGFMASPAVAGNALFLRTKTHLYRIGG
ncbi:MAG: PQQ-binding-like beta-propeller repeat protein [Candidatus Hydrogenedens sp.]|nr:PQQ-like beta-propeller repeat protein [Candidatus Hydrogenedentota bacterium]NLF59225.1 PQQ-binding-like beta-propeller repeat protein [Candidatus Hydrogenedens sp.]